MASNKENERAERIARRINEYHAVLAGAYEDLVDRDFKKVEVDLRFLIHELRITIKSLEEDDF